MTAEGASGCGGKENGVPRLIVPQSSWHSASSYVSLETSQ
jgi:hypothetical protein